MTAIISGKRRFTCLSPRLVRLEFSPTGVFEERHSLVAYDRPQPIEFDRVEERDGKLTFRCFASTAPPAPAPGSPGTTARGTWTFPDAG